MIRALIHASEVLTGEGVRAKSGRRISTADMGRIPDGALVVSTKKIRGREIPDRVEWVGPSQALPKKFARAKKTDLKGRSILMPGLVDCHTHLVFAGDRSEEFAARAGGATYEEIAARGGGILSSVRATREASAQDLVKLALPRIQESMSYGVRTLEIKSGYGLSTETELKMLEVIARLRERFPELMIQSTFLGAHAVPGEISREAYIRELTERMLPEIAKRKLADACDVFVDQGYYTVPEARHILECARNLRLKIKVHADELSNTESAAFAANMKALSADHLLRISESGISALARSETVAVLLPGTAFYLKAAHAPARALLDAGTVVALATDFNPGTCMTLNLPAVMTIAALYLGMRAPEIFAAVTYNAAKALGLEVHRGTLEPGMDAAFAVMPVRKFEEIYYRFAWNPRNGR